MPANTAPIFPGSISNKAVNFAASIAQTLTLITGGTNGTVIVGLNLYQDSAAAVAVTLGIKISGTSYKLCKFSTPATADYVENLIKSARIPAVDDYQGILVLGAGHILEMTVPSVANNVAMNIFAGDL